MTRTSSRDALARALELGTVFAESVATRRVFPDAPELARAAASELPDQSSDPVQVIEELAHRFEPAVVATTGPRYFGFVTGGSLTAAMAADCLATIWDQPAALYAMSPAASIVEDIAARWLLDVLKLPPTCSVGFVTGATMANFTALAAARHELLRRAGWNVEADGLFGAPPVRVIVGAEAHASIFAALRMLGFGAQRVDWVDADEQGRMVPASVEAQLLEAPGTPTIVCAQAGNVNTGAVDPLHALGTIARSAGVWLHVDGAFGLWAGASPCLAHLVAGVDLADSWATDAHKWLNVPYDSGIVAIAHPAAHRAAMSVSASYLLRSADEPREPMDWTPEASRRARGFAIYAALRSLGRSGLAGLIERCCALARGFALELAKEPTLRVLNAVVLNQVLVRVVPLADAPLRPRDDAEHTSDALTRDVLTRVQREGVCWVGGTRWRNMEAMRISVSNWSTTEEDIRRSAASIAAAARAAAAEHAGRVL